MAFVYSGSWIVDYDQVPSIYVGRDLPTLVSWDLEPAPIRYDVIRGDVSNLTSGVGETVDLGQVVCVEDDSTDASTAGSEDSDAPLPGQAFFYLYRGSAGSFAGPGSWGSGGDGAERLTESGGCTSR